MAGGVEVIVVDRHRLRHVRGCGVLGADLQHLVLVVVAVPGHGDPAGTARDADQIVPRLREIAVVDPHVAGPPDADGVVRADPPRGRHVAEVTQDDVGDVTLETRSRSKPDVPRPVTRIRRPLPSTTVLLPTATGLRSRIVRSPAKTRCLGADPVTALRNVPGPLSAADRTTTTAGAATTGSPKPT